MVITVFAFTINIFIFSLRLIALSAFAHMGSYKSAGPDGFKPLVMKHFGPKALGCINNLFQAIYSTGYIPIEFCKSKVVFIPKPLKDYYEEAGSFRPISLTQFLFKAMERIIEWSLREHDDKMGVHMAIVCVIFVFVITFNFIQTRADIVLR